MHAKSSTGYVALSEPHVHKIEVKKSVFIAYAWPTATGSDALALIESHKDLSASHNCFAWRIGAGGNDYRSSDDGEPGGTAGRPILASIEGEDMSDTTVMVTRFFGGTKLGTGGLVRAYGQAARDCLRGAKEEKKTFFKKPRRAIKISISFDFIGKAYQAIDAVAGERIGEEYTTDCVILSCSVNEDDLDSLKNTLMDVTAGKVAIDC